MLASLGADSTFVGRTDELTVDVNAMWTTGHIDPNGERLDATDERGSEWAFESGESAGRGHAVSGNETVGRSPPFAAYGDGSR
jgi:hypothetical protein